MNIQDLFNENEKPLDRIPENGGFAAIFHTVACVGDSLASGEFESFNAEGKISHHDQFEHSWGQYMARLTGSKVYNFSRGGMTAKEYNESFGEKMGFWNPKLAAEAYVMALGVNDILNRHWELGTVADIRADWRENADTFAGHYGALIQRYKEIQPKAKFFLMTMANYPTDHKHFENTERHAALLYELAEFFPNTYVLDIRRYGPVHDEFFREKFYMGGHMNPMGYLLMGHITAAYIDYIVRHNTADFKEVGFIGTDLKHY